MAQSGSSRGAEAVIAKAHHGSVSKEQRALIEDDLKRGRLPAVVATSSLELGIDMGAVDLVIQIESPPSVASALQRVGRAGHQVGEVSRGVLFPKHRGDLAQTAVAVAADAHRRDRVAARARPTRSTCWPSRSWPRPRWTPGTVDDLFDLVRRSAPFAQLPAVGVRRDPRPAHRPLPERRVRRAAPAHRLGPGHRHAHRAARRPAARGHQRRHHPRPRPVRRLPGRRRGPGRRVGELDEEMVYESRVGDVFALGATSWRIEDITHDRVLVTPAPGVPGRLPFWKGDTLGRPAELGEAVGAFTRELAAMPAAQGRARGPASAASTTTPPPTWSPTSTSSARPPRCCPATRRSLVERFRDELGDWRLVVHSPYGTPGPRALGAGDQRPAARALRRRRPGGGLRRRHRDPDPRHRRRAARRRGGRLRARRDRATSSPRRSAARRCSPPGSASARPAPCCSRAATPAAAARCGSSASARAALLEVAVAVPVVPDRARGGPRVPPGRLRPARAGRADAAASSGARSRSSTSRPTQPSPVRPQPALRLRRPVRLRGRLPHRRAPGRRALARPGPARRAARPGRAARAARPRGARRGRGRAAAARARPAGPRRRGRRRPAPAARARSPPRRSARAASTAPTSSEWLAALADARRVVEVRMAGEERWAAVEDVGRLRDGLGVAGPARHPRRVHRARRRPARRPGRPLRPHPRPVHHRRGRRPARARRRRRPADPAAAGRARAGCSTASSGPAGVRAASGATPRCCARCGAARWPGCARRSSRSPPDALGRFLPAWQHVGGKLRGVDGVLVGRSTSSPAARCRPAPSSRWCWPPGCATTSRRTSTSSPPPARCSGPATARCPAPTAGSPAPRRPGAAHAARARAVRAQRAPPGRARRARARAARGSSASSPTQVGSTDDKALSAALWDLVWAGPGQQRHPHPAARADPRRHAQPPHQRPPARPRMASTTGRGGATLRTGPPETAGRWALLPERDTDPTRRAHAARRAAARPARRRHPRRGRQRAACRAASPAVYKVLSRVRGLRPLPARLLRRGAGRRPVRHRRRGRPAAHLQRGRRRRQADRGLPGRHRPGQPLRRRAPLARASERRTATGRAARPAPWWSWSTAQLVLYVERGGRTLLTWSDDADRLAPAAASLAEAARRGALGRLTVERADGAAAARRRLHARCARRSTRPASSPPREG